MQQCRHTDKTEKMSASDRSMSCVAKMSTLLARGLQRNVSKGAGVCDKGIVGQLCRFGETSVSGRITRSQGPRPGSAFTRSHRRRRGGQDQGGVGLDSRGAVTLGGPGELVVRHPPARQVREWSRDQGARCAPVAQGTEQRFPKPRVGGSSPSGGTNTQVRIRQRTPISGRFRTTVNPQMCTTCALQAWDDG
jgi:hypothetical protein